MKIKDQEFSSGNIRIRLKAAAIDMLQNMPSGGGVEASRQQIALAEKLESANGEFDLTPEDAALIRTLINSARHLPPAIQVPMYDALDPKVE